MPRPLPLWPRGPRRLRKPTSRLLLGCPRLSPEWELSSVRALIKPQLRGAVEHRHGRQVWRRGSQGRVEATLGRVNEILNLPCELQFPTSGEFYFVGHVPAARLDEAKVVALALSDLLPGVWLVLGRLFVKDRRFFRRRFGYRLEIVPATNVHVPRELRQVLKEVL